MLEEPIDPRVNRILSEINTDKASAEIAFKRRRIIKFPNDETGGRHVVQDEGGFWRIVPDYLPETVKSLSDRL